MTDTPRWVSLATAAEHLDESIDGLRKKITRAATPGEDGVLEANISGLRARRLGRHWKVRLEGWQ